MRPTTCDSTRLDSFLKGQLTEQDEAELTQHLSHCANCAAQLEDKAAAQSRWQDAKLHLSDSWIATTPPSDHSDQGNQPPLSVRQVLEMLDPTDDPGSLGRIGGYEVLGVVGSGAMGVVLKAADRTLDRIVALKVMNPSLAACGTARQRFEREAKAAAGVLHPNVIAIHGVSTDQVLPFLVMPYVPGVSLQQRLEKQGPLLLPEILRIGSQVAAGLAAAHQKGLIHRDIKPSNIMLDSGVETALITDFGLARTIDDATMTRSGAITGTPEYMSPEQARGEVVEFRSDVFSLGSVLYGLCTGQRPFQAQTQYGVLRKISDETPTSIRDVNPDIPLWFCGIVEQMFSKSPEHRPSAAEVRDTLEGCLAHVYQPDRIPLPDGLLPSFQSSSSVFSRPLTIGAIAFMTISLLALSVIAIFQSTSFWETSNAETTPEPVATSEGPEVFKTLNLMFPQQNKRGKLIVDINRGFVEVSGHDRPGVVIEIIYPPATKASVAAADQDLQPQFAPSYDLKTVQASNSIKLDTYNQDYPLNLRIKVPYETDLSLDTYYNGYLEVKNVSGTIDTHTQHSDIRLLDIAGSATGYSRNGNLTIGFRELASNANLDFESYNGTVDLSLPSLTAATTAVSTDRGNYFSAFKIDAVADSENPKRNFPKIKNSNREYQFGTINGGGIPIRLESTKGKILLRKTDLTKK